MKNPPIGGHLQALLARNPRGYWGLASKRRTLAMRRQLPCEPDHRGAGEVVRPPLRNGVATAGVERDERGIGGGCPGGHRCDALPDEPVFRSRQKTQGQTLAPRLGPHPSGGDEANAFAALRLCLRGFDAKDGVPGNLAVRVFSHDNACMR